MPKIYVKICHSQEISNRYAKKLRGQDSRQEGAAGKDNSPPVPMSDQAETVVGIKAFALLL